ncbi:uncharacterized protein LOC121870788 [Homarus americanus]|uniref:uncharacterized protein LOC121870788 n=1 Tax=Homarus americanus TaxID=6706 RepID=UPI001C48731E|nr:uncharacterized protein LOC121870788 [Homarus americanus]
MVRSHVSGRCVHPGRDLSEYGDSTVWASDMMIIERQQYLEDHLRMAQSEQEASGQHHFRRGGSRVYYASESGCWPANNLPRDFWNRHRATREPVILEAGEETFSSGEEALEGEASPGGSFRGSLRGSPSHRSQDSGYSDSGESTNAHNDGDSLPTTPPNVKHITRVYFGENPCLYNDKIVCIQTVNVTTTNVSSTSPDTVDTALPDAGPYKSQRHDRSGSLEELAEELEHKSVLDASTKRTGAVKKRVSSMTAMMGQRRPQRRSSSAEKLLVDVQAEQHRRPTAGRTRRRWSISDVQHQHLKLNSRQQQQPHAGPSHVSCGTNTHVTCGTNTRVPCGTSGRNSDVELMSRAIDSRPPECEEDPVAGETHPGTVRQPRTRPVKLAQEMRNPSLLQWLKELSVLYESECMNTLQSKSLPEVWPPPTTSTTSTSTSSSTLPRRQGHPAKAHAVSTEFVRLCQRLEWLERQVPALAGLSVGHINNFPQRSTTQ